MFKSKWLIERQDLHASSKNDKIVETREESSVPREVTPNYGVKDQPSSSYIGLYPMPRLESLKF